MASISLTVIGSAVGELQSSVTLSSEDGDRLMAFLVATHGRDSEGNARTPQQMIEAYWSAMVSGTLANVINYEREAAAREARDAVKPINLVE